MTQSVQVEGAKTFLNGEAARIEAHRRVKLKNASTTTPMEVVYADAGEAAIGVTMTYADAGAQIAVMPMTKTGTFWGEAADTFSRDADLYGADDGKISDTASGSCIGKAIDACTGAGDICEWIVYPTLSTTAGTVSIADAGGFTSETTVEGATQEIYQDLLTAQATIPVSLGAITEEDGTALTKQATTVAGYSQLSDKELVINIPVDCTEGEALAFSKSIPQDLDDSADITVHVLVGKDADNDVLTLDCEVFPVAAGDTANADIQDTAAQSITQAASELTFTCGADGVLAAPGALSVVLTLGGTNDGDAVYIYGVWIEYTRAILAA